MWWFLCTYILALRTEMCQFIVVQYTSALQRSVFIMHCYNILLLDCKQNGMQCAVQCVVEQGRNVCRIDNCHCRCVLMSNRPLGTVKFTEHFLAFADTFRVVTCCD